MLPRVSIITVNFNGRAFLADFFASLKKMTYPRYEVILADNASTDWSIGEIKKKYPWVKLLVNRRNLGFALANNEAAKEAKGE